MMARYNQRAPSDSDRSIDRHWQSCLKKTTSAIVEQMYGSVSTLLGTKKSNKTES